MVLAPSLRIRDVHLVAQHIPHHTGLLPRIKRLHCRHTLKFVKHLIMRKCSAVATPKHLFKQLPKFSFMHAPQVYTATTPMKMPGNACRAYQDMRNQAETESR